ncbi:circularly permuted type 2 ATP-grasp protein, partial [Candidatus Poribacteria bacterium]|nr:circularly permuted type 2 ATP-grasp protein [Candidatus Poribacteria bacterium]
MTGFDGYDTEEFYDEMFAPDGSARPAAQMLMERIESFPDGELNRRQIAAEYALLRMGITFNVYADEQGIEKIFPFDLIPRIIDATEWEWIERGLKQRIHALNLFIDDVYHDQKILKDGVVPSDVVLSSERYLKPCIGLDPPRGIWCHITGTDLVRDSDGQFYVLEDNLGCPSGVSYVVENRQLMKRTFPQIFGMSQIQPVEDYPSHLLNMLRYLVTDRVPSPTVALLTPGIYNSAYFEHSFLAQQMGVELVEGRDLVVMDGFVHARTTKGFERVDVLYRRINDDFLDPKAFKSESMLGVPGLMDVYKAGRIALVNAPGTCVADDKVVCSFVPEIIKYYLGEDIIVPNVPTYMCWEDSDRKYVLEHLDELVVKEANQSGGYGMLIGPHSTRAEQEEFADRIKNNPRNYIA